MKPQTEMCERCRDKPSLVGNGEQWLCQECWNADLTKASKFIHKLQDEFEQRRTDRAEK